MMRTMTIFTQHRLNHNNYVHFKLDVIITCTNELAPLPEMPPYEN